MTHKIKLGETVSFFNYKRKPLSAAQRHHKQGNYPYYGASGIIDYVDEFAFDGRYLLISEDGDNLKSRKQPIAFIAEGKFLTNNHIHVLTGIDDETLDYLKFYFSQLDIFPYLTGAVQQKLSKKVLENIEIIFPSYQKRKAINQKLNNLENKIQLNLKMSETLEEMAKTLFKHEVLNVTHKIKKGEISQDNWTFQTLGDVFEVSIGKTPPRKEKQWFSSNSQDVPWLSIKDMGRAGVFVLDNQEYLTEQAIDTFKIKRIPENTVILSFKITIGRVAITTKEIVTNEAIAHFKIKKNSLLTSEYLYLFLKQFDFQCLGSTSSIVEITNTKTLRKIEIPIPPQQIMAKLQEKIAPLFAEIKNLTLETQQLKNMQNVLFKEWLSQLK